MNRKVARIIDWLILVALMSAMLLAYDLYQVRIR
jgi:hypothetical protein